MKRRKCYTQKEDPGMKNQEILVEYRFQDARSKLFPYATDSRTPRSNAFGKMAISQVFDH